MRFLKKDAFFFIWLMGCLFLLALAKIQDYDVWYHLMTGKVIIETGKIPNQDIFSHTMAGKPWIAHEWLSQSFLYFTYTHIGFRGLILFKAFMVIGTFAFVYSLCKKSAGNSFIGVVLTFWGALVSAGSWLERPQMFSYFFFSFVLFTLAEFQNGNKRCLYILPPLCLLWVNMHSSFILLFVVMALWMFTFLLKERRGGNWGTFRMVFLITCACAFFSLLNPYGASIWAYPFNTLLHKSHASLISEWQSPNFHLPQNLLFEGLFFLTLFSLAEKSRFSLLDVLLFLLFSHMSLYSIRFFPLFGIAAPVLVSKRASLIFKKKDPLSSKDHPFINAFLISALFVLCIYKFPKSNTFSECVDKSQFPVKAVNFIIRNNVQGNIFNEYDWGGFLIFKFYPGRKVFIDGRMDVYQDKVGQEFVDVIRFKENWKEILDRYRIKVLLIKTNSPFYLFLRQGGDFKMVYRDSLSAVFVQMK